MQHTVAICQDDTSSDYQPGLTQHHLWFICRWEKQ